MQDGECSDATTLLKDRTFNRAVSNILQRSERQNDIARLVDIYVDVGIVPQLENNNNQIIYGRRGTGKTHIFKVLQKRFEEENATSVVYIDCRVLGSTAQFSDDTYSMNVRCLALFRDFMSIIHNELLNLITSYSGPDGEKLFDLLFKLSNAFSVDKENVSKEEITITEHGKDSCAAGLNGRLGLEGGRLDTKIGFSEELSKGVTEVYKVSLCDKVIFGDIYYFVKEILAALSCRLVLLVDEWSSLPQDIQPFFQSLLSEVFLQMNWSLLKLRLWNIDLNLIFRLKVVF